MPNPKKPDATKMLRGTYKASRSRKTIPIAPDELSFDAPNELTTEEAKLWRSAVANAPGNVLKNIDRTLLIIWCKAEARYLRAAMLQHEQDKTAPRPMLIQRGNGAWAPSPYVIIMENTGRLMVRLASALGFSPTSSLRVASESPSKTGATDDPWARVRALQSDPADDED